ncbi:DUF262 domain-containing protein [Streptomyces sp. SID3343]|uniref:GmrSD restriction endonuclease domain-containing protein n=1 Tax=Streptomyces sp. SID3343 TaxID=2690260 RepID=UPI0013687111|nr:DUF262 domain-containing protein [Streptomyces sp. SID3343]MYV98398.1 DUF262 domain-containing protein [Streptomyces sp. SID3343]
MGLANENIISQVEDLLAGRIVIPSIQRDYVWKTPDIRDLLDSLYRGYPIGSVLLWKTKIRVPFRAAAVSQDAQSVHQPVYLLDGQQRLISLAWVYRPESRADAKKLDLRFDLANEQFVSPPGARRNDPLLIPVVDVLASAPEFFRILTAAGVDPATPVFQTYFTRLQKLHDIHKREIAVITYTSDDYEEVADVFARVNKGGRKLTKGDLVYSAIAARWEDGLATIEAFHAELARDGFALDRDPVLRVLGHFAGVGLRSIRLLDSSVTESVLEQAWAKTAESVRMTVRFLREECGVPRSAVLKTQNVLVAPSILLHRRDGRLDPAETDRLRRWIYTILAFMRYTGASETAMESDVRWMDMEPGQVRWRELTHGAFGTRSVDAPVQAADLEHKSNVHALFNVLYIAALRRDVRDWVDGDRLDDSREDSSARIEYHHVFPDAAIAGAHPKELRNSVANFAFVSSRTKRAIGTRTPARYIPTLDREHLTGHWMPMDPALWTVEAFPEFLAQRRRLMAATLNAMLGLPGGEEAHEPVPAAASPVGASAEEEEDSDRYVYEPLPAAYSRGESWPAAPTEELDAEARFWEQLASCSGPAEVRLVEELLEFWVVSRGRVDFGDGTTPAARLVRDAKDGTSVCPMLVFPSAAGSGIEVQFRELGRHQRFASEPMREELRSRLNVITGVDIRSQHVRGRPNFPLNLLEEERNRAVLYEVFAWLKDVI